MTIDSHHHFWNYNAQEYDWLGDNMAGLRRDFLPSDLKKTIVATGIDGVISVQARQELKETEWLLKLANEHEFIRGVVGWVPLAASNIESVLEGFSSEKKLKAVRHVVQGEADGFLNGESFNAGIRSLAKFDFVYDILIFERQLAEAITFVDRHPNQVFVLDHIAKPRIKEAVLQQWQQQIADLAKRENVFCKISGMVTEADFEAWTPAALTPYFETVLEAFGPKRLMFGSDWPVCLAACEYGRWVQVVRDWTANLSADENAAFWGETAGRAYKL